MPSSKCFHPVVAKYDGSKVYFPRSKEWVHYNPNMKVINLPCGRCRGCRLEYARQWAIRCTHEAMMHEENSFLTLTFNNESLPPDGSLNVATFQKFMKKVRNHTKKKDLRYFHCGEYGDKYGRPHYHVLLFGHDFKDKKKHKLSSKNFNLYTSEKLQELWPFGYSYIGDVSFESASYVARYIFKKTDDRKEIHDDLNRLPEYCTMSRNPGIGKSWYLKHGWKSCHANDVINIKRNDKIIQSKPPRYYDELLKAYDEENGTEYFQKIKEKRIQQMGEPLNSTIEGVERLSVLEEVNDIKIKKQMRKLELDS